MKKIKVFSFLLFIAIIASFSSVAAFACTYEKEEIRGNIETITYYTNGTVSTTYSWGNTNDHPSYTYSEWFDGYAHTGKLYKFAWSSDPSNTVHYTTGNISKVVTTVYYGGYKGLISNVYHYYYI